MLTFIESEPLLGIKGKTSAGCTSRFVMVALSDVGKEKGNFVVGGGPLDRVLVAAVGPVLYL